MLLFRLLTGFCDFYGSNFGNSACITSRAINPSPGSYYVLDCSYSIMRIIGSGSVFYFSSSNPVKMLVESSSFYNCSSTDHGGAIHFNCMQNGGFVSHKVCATICYTNNPTEIARGQFIWTNINDTMINGVLLSSICLCSEAVRLQQWYSIALYKGNFRFKTTNSSKNTVHHIGIFGTSLCSSLSCGYNNFEQIFSPSGAHIMNAVTSLDNFIEFSNFINNTNQNSNRGIVDAFEYGIVNINDCVFTKNTGLLFSASIKFNLVAKNCYIFHENGDYQFNSTFLNCETREDVGSHNLLFFSTKYCHTLYRIPLIVPKFSCYIDSQNIRKYIISLLAETILID